jgi:hypothetical protein
VFTSLGKHFALEFPTKVLLGLGHMPDTKPLTRPGVEMQAPPYIRNTVSPWDYEAPPNQNPICLGGSGGQTNGKPPTQAHCIGPPQM